MDVSTDGYFKPHVMLLGRLRGVDLMIQAANQTMATTNLLLTFHLHSITSPRSVLNQLLGDMMLSIL